MATQPTNGLARRALVADSGIRIIARDGLRALTHRAVDREAGLPEGTTSYHAKTRLSLLELIVEALARRSTADAERTARTVNETFDRAEKIGTDDLARLFASLVQTLATRRDDMRARYALILELDDSPQLKDTLTAQSDVHATTQRVTAMALGRAGLPATNDRVEELIAMTEGLLFVRTAVDADTPLKPVFAAYLKGVAAQAG